MDLKAIENSSTSDFNLNKKGPRELMSEELMQISGGGGIGKIIGKVVRVVIEALGLYAAEKGLEEIDDRRKNK